MKLDFWLDQIPSGVYLSYCLWLFYSPSGSVQLWGAAERSKPTQEAEAPLGTVSGATLGLLAFMLAFTFGFCSGTLSNPKAASS